jgi:beta-glucanase (GH16 family)
MFFKSLALLAGAATVLSPFVQAQTFTSCNPMNTTCPNDPALGTNHNFYFNTSSTVTNYFDITAGSLKYGDKGAEFTISKEGESPTIQSKFYIFFGKVSIIMQAAKGRGIVSSIVLESDDLDEVDWEMLGSNTTHAETNYFGKGNTTAYDRATWDLVSSDPTDNFHNYTVDWTAERIEWWIDDVRVRVLHYEDALGGKNFPQTPMTVRLGIWSGGDPKLNPQGTIEWAQGETDFSQVPFTMYVKEALIEDYSSGKEYQWTDKSGDWQSIKVIR